MGNKIADANFAEAEAKLIWGFYEGDHPEYTQGDKKLHELHELVTAEDCNGLVKNILGLQERIVELETFQIEASCKTEGKCLWGRMTDYCSEMTEYIGELKRVLRFYRDEWADVINSEFRPTLALEQDKGQKAKTIVARGLRKRRLGNDSTKV